ncbi:FliC/FljB family flagellin [Edwardsiella tarda]
MAQVINTNSLSLMAQNNLNKSQSALGTAIERLSSGLRINSAKDDAAGQAISNRFTANINGLTQASRNANDGISLAQTTEGALNEVNDNLQNIRRLTVQAQNGSNSSSDLQSIQDEITQRLNEIDRISQQTDFNGVKVLSKDQKLTIQVGANDGETIDIDLKNINKNTLGLDTFSVANGTVDVKKVGASAPTEVGTGTMVAIDANSKTAAGAAPVSYVKDNDSGDIYALDNTGKGYKVTLADTKTDGKIGSIDTTAVDMSGKNVTTTTQVEKTVAVSGAAADKSGLRSYGEGQYVIKEGDKYFKASVDTAGKITRGKEMALDPLKSLDNALSQVDQLRSGLGAVQNRFDSVINNLNSTVNNLSASRSRIQDADYATEVSNMSRAQILQQAGTSVLAQANQSTQNVLSLLR